jgi:hypothetical protein
VEQVVLGEGGSEELVFKSELGGTAVEPREEGVQILGAPTELTLTPPGKPGKTGPAGLEEGMGHRGPADG